MSPSNNVRRFLQGLIILFLSICMSSAYGQNKNVSASISNGGPQPGTITVPAGSTASGFRIINLTSGYSASGSVDFYGFFIYIFGTTTVAYSYYVPKGGKSVETPAPVTLATLVLNPGKYSVYVSGGPSASLLLAYNLGGGGSKQPQPSLLKSGQYHMTANGFGFVVILAVNGSTFEGKMSGDVIKNGVISGDAVTFHRDSYGYPQGQDYEGRIQGNKIVGTFTGAGGEPGKTYPWEIDLTPVTVTPTPSPSSLPSQPNLARNKPATQSSLYANNANTYGPQIGVDGVNDQGFFHTNIEDAPWWQVDLQGTHQLKEIRLFNRAGICLERANHIQVKLSISGSDWETVYNHDGTVWERLNINVAGKSARFVRVQLAENNYLHLAEVEVY